MTLISRDISKVLRHKQFPGLQYEKKALNSSCASELFMELLKFDYAWGLTLEVVIIARVENHWSRERTEGKN